MFSRVHFEQHAPTYYCHAASFVWNARIENFPLLSQILQFSARSVAKKWIEKTDSYLSRAMAHRLRMDAVQQRTSAVSHILQRAEPNSHLPITVYTMFIGNTHIDTVKSAIYGEVERKRNITIMPDVFYRRSFYYSFFWNLIFLFCIRTWSYL